MRKSEIKVGGEYLAKVNGTMRRVRVIDIRPGATEGGTRYDYLRCDGKGHALTCRSASKFHPLPRVGDHVAVAAALGDASPVSAREGADEFEREG